MVFSDSSDIDENTSEVVNNHPKTSKQTWNDINRIKLHLCYRKHDGQNTFYTNYIKMQQKPKTAKTTTEESVQARLYI